MNVDIYVSELSDAISSAKESERKELNEMLLDEGYILLERGELAPANPQENISILQFLLNVREWTTRDELIQLITDRI